VSHVTTMKMTERVRDLDLLEQAVAAIPALEFRRDQRTFRWFEQFMGDSTPPKGRDPKDYGKCAHAIALKGDRSAYEIGVVPAIDGDGFDLMVDTWGQRKLLAAIGGPSAQRIQQEYKYASALRAHEVSTARRGFRSERETLPNGTVRLVLERR
jgi:hypothetical protein